uniref:Uncharacterized protein n=1 Tax=Oryza sativa subsp. japonica TaxID=39947 RepID=Q7EYS2_ORYSJ|nr:hypothetical protein [Oryza sativa Japonica Group]
MHQAATRGPRLRSRDQHEQQAKIIWQFRCIEEQPMFLGSKGEIYTSGEEAGIWREEQGGCRRRDTRRQGEEDSSSQNAARAEEAGGVDQDGNWRRRPEDETGRRPATAREKP